MSIVPSSPSSPGDYNNDYILPYNNTLTQDNLRSKDTYNSISEENSVNESQFYQSVLGSTARRIEMLSLKDDRKESEPCPPNLFATHDHMDIDDMNEPETSQNIGSSEPNPDEISSPKQRSRRWKSDTSIKKYSSPSRIRRRRRMRSPPPPLSTAKSQLGNLEKINGDSGGVISLSSTSDRKLPDQEEQEIEKLYPLPRQKTEHEKYIRNQKRMAQIMAYKANELREGRIKRYNNRESIRNRGRVVVSAPQSENSHQVPIGKGKGNGKGKESTTTDDTPPDSPKQVRFAE